MEKTIIDIGWKGLDIYVEGQKVLHIGQVSDDNVINLFFKPEGDAGILNVPGSSSQYQLISTRKKGAADDKILAPRQTLHIKKEC